jgi:prepilin-type N-terminal cleavage/methylation domain-containing protein
MIQNLIPNTRDKINNSNKGFSLIEILVVISIISIVLSIAVINGRNFNNSIDLENTVKSVDAKIKLAKAYSIGAKNETNYGVHFEADKVVVFRGSAFIDGAPTNENFIFSSKIKINMPVNLAGGGSDLVFDRLVGSTSNFGSIEMSVISEPSKTKQIIINSDGQTSLSSFQSSSNSIIKNARHAHFSLGWNIASATTLTLRWVDGFENTLAINNINIASNLNADQSVFDWTGTTQVDGVDQEIRIHSWLDASNNTVLCVMRKQTENKKLYIFTNPGLKDIATYENVSGEVNVTQGFYGGIMDVK